MDITVSCFPDTKRSAIGPRFSDRLHFHIEPSLLSTGNVEGCVAVRFVTLYAGPRTSLLADVTGQLPTGGWDVFYAVYGLQEDRVRKTDLGDPEGAHHVGPTAIVCLFEGAAFVWTQGTVHGPGRRLQAAAAQPLAFWDIRDPIAFLVHSQVTHVTKKDDVAILTFPIIANATDGILIYQGVWVTFVVTLKIGFLL